MKSLEQKIEHTMHMTLLRSRFWNWSPALVLGRIGAAFAAAAAHVILVFGRLGNVKGRQESGSVKIGD